MLNRTVSSWRQSRRQSGGGHASMPRTPSLATGIRKHWRTFGLKARSILCICTEGPTDADYRATTGVDAPCTTRAGNTLPPPQASSRNAAAPPYAASNSTQRRSHPEEKKDTSEEAESAWSEIEKTAWRPRPHSEPSAARRRQRKISALSDLCGEGSQSYDDELHHHMARLQLTTATAAAGGRIQATPSTSGDSTDALRRKTLRPTGANRREEKPGGAAQKPSSSLRLQEGEEGGPENEKGADARRAAWEALKRHVLYAEEHGGPPLDMGGGHDAERALRELRAQLRQGWAEEAVRTRVREEHMRSTKKRRRGAGWWIRENGVLLRCTVTHTRALEST